MCVVVTTGSGLPVHPRSAQRLASIDAATTQLHPDFGPSYGDQLVPYGTPGYVDVGHSAMLLVFALVWIIQSVWLADRLEAVVDELAEPKQA